MILKKISLTAHDSSMFPHFVWLSISPKHYLCTVSPPNGFSCVIPRPAVPSTFPWSSTETNQWREYESVLRDVGEKPWFTFLDIYRMSEYRYDGHAGVGFGGDRNGKREGEKQREGESEVASFPLYLLFSCAN